MLIQYLEHVLDKHVNDPAHVLDKHVNDFGNVDRPWLHKIKNTSTAKRHFTAQAIFNCG